MPGLHSKRQADAAMGPGMLLGGQAWPAAARGRQALDTQHGRNDQSCKGQELQERSMALLTSAHSLIIKPQATSFPAVASGQAHNGDAGAAAWMGSAGSAPTPHYPGAPASGGSGVAHPAVVDWAAAAAMHAMQSTATMACSQGGAHMQTGQSSPARNMISQMVHLPQQRPAEQAAAAYLGHVVGQAAGGMSNSDAVAIDAEQPEQLEGLESASQLQPGAWDGAAASHQVAQVASDAAGGGRRKRGRREDKHSEENTDGYDEVPDAAGRARKRTAQA